MPRRCPLPLASLLLVILSAPVAADGERVDADEELLRSAGLATDGPALLNFFRKRTLRDVDRTRVQALIRRLGDERFVVREQASQDLVDIGPGARALLREATRDPDLETARRAERCLRLIDRAATPAVVAAAARLVGRRQPVGAVAVLLGAAPEVEEENATTALVGALAAVGFRAGKADPALLAALRAGAPARRAAAAEALCRAGGAAERRAVHRLLDDAELSVRRRAAVALVEARDKEAIPTLIDLGTELPTERAWALEERLVLLAGESAPGVSLDESAASKRRWRDAWKGWWREHGSTLDLARVDWSGRLLGYTLITEYNRVREIDAAGKVRWEIPGLNYPSGAQVVGPNRVLIAESESVTERTFKNEVRWRKAVAGQVVAVSRQRDGSTFVATRRLIFEMDRTGKEIYTIRPRGGAAGACRLPDGTVALVNRRGRFIHMDREGKELRSFSIGSPMLYGSTVQMLPDGRVLLPLHYQNKVAEFDRTGKIVWEASVQRALSAQRLPNGHTLVVGRYLRVVELNRAGKEVWSDKGATRPMRALRR